MRKLRTESSETVIRTLFEEEHHRCPYYTSDKDGEYCRMSGRCSYENCAILFWMTVYDFDHWTKEHY
jgi:hypothetical protein